MATKRAMATATRVVDDEEGNSKVVGDGDKSVGRGTATTMKREMATATRVVGDKEGKGGKKDGCGDNSGGRGRG
jgi:hypothetical protein